MSIEVLNSIKKGDRVLLYPSSCPYIPAFQNVPHDVVILNSASIKPGVIGKVYCLNVDNNELLGVLLAKSIRLSSVLIICDGCVEGGNYECCAKDGFFGRLIPILSQPFEYSRDHGPEIDLPAHFAELETPDYLDAFIKASAPWQMVKSYHAKATQYEERELVLGNIRVRIIRDSIWQAYDQPGLIVVKDSYAVAKYMEGLCKSPNLAANVEKESRSRLTSIEPWLRRADELGLRRASFIPMGGNRYKKIIKEVQCWDRDYPKEISFYHLNENDYQDFTSLFG